MDDLDIHLTISQVISKYGLLENRGRAKSFGQHFLTDMSLLKKIAGFAKGLVLPDTDILEIGPGPCGLTRAILDVFPLNRLFCIEKDKSLAPLHSNIKSSFGDRLNFVYEDALRLLPKDLSNRDVVVIANLPYNVGTQIFINIIRDIGNVKGMILMFQKEVAQRICSDVGCKTYGRLTVLSQLLCRNEVLFDVSPKAFFPSPKVVSSVIKSVPLDIAIGSIEKLEKLTDMCFQNRRKMIFSILRWVCKEDVLVEELAALGIDKQLRPENITPWQFLELANRLFS